MIPILHLNNIFTQVSKKKKIATAVGFFFLFFCFFVLVHERAVESQRTKTDTDWSLIARSITPSDHVLGSVLAPVQVIVYADFECKYCDSLFRRDIPRLQKGFGDSIVIAFRHLPLPIQPGSQIEAEASECVYQEGGDKAFWQFAQYMFEQPKNIKRSTDTTLQAAVQAAGVTVEYYAQCMKEGKGKERVARDKIEGSIAGMSITPSLLLKSSSRALIVMGDYYSQIYSGIHYLLSTIQRYNSMSERSLQK